MSNNKTNNVGGLNIDPSQTAALLGLSGGSGGPLQEQFLSLMVEDLMEQKATRDQEKANKEAFRKSRRDALLKEHAQQEALRSQCPHLKPNYQPNIGGQRDHSGHYHWICSYCMREWTDTELPVHLRVSMERVGGPL